MGLLDPKSRVLDVVLTEQGREALARSALKIAYYSLTDSTMFYETDVSGSSDVTQRVYAEVASNLPQNVISLLANDAGQITRVRSTAIPDVQVFGGQVLSGSYQNETVLTGAAFASMAGQILSSSLDNLKNNFVLGTVDEFFEDEEFKLGPARVEFALTSHDDQHSVGSTAVMNMGTVNVTTLESFFQDPLLSHIPNFQFMPPVNKQRSSDQNQVPLGEYKSISAGARMSYEDVKQELSDARRIGNLRTFKFDPAPRTNNVHLQFFEQTNTGMTKLDTIDFGTYRGEGGAPVRVVFVGKVYWDDYDTETFVRLFTVTLE